MVLPNLIFESYRETEFSSVISSSAWPSNQYWVCLNHFDFRFISYYNSDMNSNYTLQYDMAVRLYPDSTVNRDDDKIKETLQQNYARVEVYYQTLNLKSIKESPTMSVCILQKYQCTTNKLFFTSADNDIHR